MRANPLLQDVNTDLLLKNPQINVEIQRDKAAALGVTAQQIEDTLYTAYGTRQISTIFAPQNEYHGDHGGASPSSRPTSWISRSSTCARRTASSCRSTRWSS